MAKRGIAALLGIGIVFVAGASVARVPGDSPSPTVPRPAPTPLPTAKPTVEAAPKPKCTFTWDSGNNFGPPPTCTTVVATYEAQAKQSIVDFTVQQTAGGPVPTNPFQYTGSGDVSTWPASPTHNSGPSVSQHVELQTTTSGTWLGFPFVLQVTSAKPVGVDSHGNKQYEVHGTGVVHLVRKDQPFAPQQRLNVTF